MNVENLMTRKVVTCGPDDMLDQAARRMWDADVGCLPVVDDEGRPIGMITDRDICMAAYTQGIALRDAKVSSGMSRTLITCAPDTSIHELEATMQRAQIRRVPVVDVTGSLLGIVTVGDIARYAKSSPIHVPSAPGLAKTLAAIVERRAQPVAAE